jgi:hypothetical protein
VVKKKIWANFQRIIELFTQKIVTKLSKIWIWDPGSEIRDPEKTYSGSRIQGSKRHRIPDPDPQHWVYAVPILRYFKERECEMGFLAHTVPTGTERKDLKKLFYIAHYFPRLISALGEYAKYFYAKCGGSRSGIR